METVIQFDPAQLIVAGVPLMVLVFGLVEFFKSLFMLNGKLVTVMSFGIGAVLGGLYIFDVPYVSQVVMVLSIGLAASGFYKFIGDRTIKTEEVQSTKETWKDKVEARSER